MASNLNLQAMKIFLAVSELRSAGLAARSLGMSQSGVSSALARLRRDLSDVLFVQTASGMQPTTRARELLAPMREAVATIEGRILADRRFDAATCEREFTIALSDVAEAIYMARALNAISLAAPGVRLRAVEMPQLQLQRGLSEGQVDLALGYFPDLQSSEFVRRKIGEHTFVCICSSANRRVIDGFAMPAYTQARHVVVEAPGRSQGLLERYLQQRGIERRIALTTPHFMSIPGTIAGSDMIATVPDPIADIFEGFQKLTRLALPFRSPVFEAHLHWSRGVHADPANRWLRATLFRAFTQSR